MTTRLIQLARPALLLAALLVAAPALRAQTPTEGYDPMRQITAQLMKANLHIVHQVTGSMTSFPDGLFELPAALAASLGAHLHLGARVTNIERLPRGGFRVAGSDDLVRGLALATAEFGEFFCGRRLAQDADQPDG